MILTNQQITDFIIDEVKKTGKLHFRKDDLYKTFLAGKEIESQAPPEDIENMEDVLPSQFINLDYGYFKEELFSYLKKHNVPFIRLEDDSLDIFASKLVYTTAKAVYDDYMKVYQIQDEIDRLSALITDPKTPEEEKIEILALQSALEEQKDKILTKY